VTPSLILATRSSPLALWQAHWFKKEIEQLGFTITLKPMITEGDRFSIKPNLAHLFQKNDFTKGIQAALKNGSANLAVHSLKDVPLQEKQKIVALSPREDPRDCLIFKNRFFSFQQLSQICEENQKKIGTSSPRRQDYLKRLLSKDHSSCLRGNVQTRINHLQEKNQLIAIVLAQAGLSRLNLNPEFATLLPLRIAPHAVGQGIMALESTTQSLSQGFLALKDPLSDWFGSVERSFLIAVKGNCQTSLGFNWITTTQVEVTYTPQYKTETHRANFNFSQTWFTNILKKSKQLYTFELWDWLEENKNWRQIRKQHLEQLLDQKLPYEAAH
jgi:hydroxymethylbilane synthase